MLSCFHACQQTNKPQNSTTTHQRGEPMPAKTNKGIQASRSEYIHRPESPDYGGTHSSLPQTIMIKNINYISISNSNIKV